ALSLWVERNYHSSDNPLHSEVSINGKSIGTFTSDTDRAIGEHVKSGWNTITLKTIPQAGATHNNHLNFRIGSVHKKKDGQRIMTPMWEFQNGTDWKLEEGNFSHQLGPETKEVTLTYKVFYAGLDTEKRKLGVKHLVRQGHLLCVRAQLMAE